jgi:glycosyltransferase involved in cell wall biosynthesis
VLGHTAKLGSVATLPFGLPDQPPVTSDTVFLRGTKIAAGDFLMVWGGGIWDWFDPFTLLLALAKVRSERSDIKAFFPGLTPPNPDAARMAVVSKFLSLARKLELLDTTVFVNEGWTPYEQRAAYLLEADAGISLHKDSLETRFAFRTRMLDYLWAGLPVIASRGDSWGDLIEQRGLGLTVPCGDADAVAAAVVKMADDAPFRDHCRSRVMDVASDFVWDKLIERLDVLASGPELPKITTRS